ncbi:MAG TPA: hypothetical protein PLP21_01205 [Pyrinomonadaceae bacterium]|nr:hypothetical protein [Acidobacteriota bacterium]HQZ94900.1 hypothetical protein [Pyrinomonadaceae bacterium]
MLFSKNPSTSRLIVCLAVVAILAFQASAQTVKTAELKAEGREFLAREIAAHFGDIKSLQSPPDRVFNALTVGDFSWGSFARALAAQADVGGSRIIAGKDTARAIAEIGLIESRKGGKSFSQLYSTLALRHYGNDLSKNAVWQSMNDAERKEWNSLLDPTRFYDPKTRKVIDLPENYLGVAARVAAMSYQMGVLKERSFLDSVVESAAKQFTDGAIYADDNPPTGRYDRYSNEYARFCWDAAEIARRKDITAKLKNTLKIQMKLWWDLVSPEGYGYNWGRSQGLVSYLDTMEIVAFLGKHSEFRPAPLTELAALYNQAWRWIRADYNDTTHMFRVFDFGRGNYAYINPSREWQQTGTGLGKIIMAHAEFMPILEKEGVLSFPAKPALPNVARFEFFAKGDKQEGVWLFREGNLRFALPITVGTKPAIADYLPAPFGISGFSAPVEEVYPSFVPFVTLADKKVYAAADGADSITPGKDGRSLKFSNTKWAQIGSKSGERFDTGLKSDVEFNIKNGVLIRRETVTAARDVEIREWKFVFPSTATSVNETRQNNARIFNLDGREGHTIVTFQLNDGQDIRIFAAGDGKLSKGVLGAIPLHLIAEKANMKLAAGQKFSWEISIEPK